MSSSISFAEFRAAAAAADPFREKALLFVYRALEDFAAELKASPAEIAVLDISPDGRGFTSALSRWGARVHPLSPNDTGLALLQPDRFDVVTLDSVLVGSRDDEILTSVLAKLDPVGLLVAVVPRGRYTPGKLERLFAKHHLSVHRMMNAGFVLSSVPVPRPLRSFDADFADLVPHWLANGWLVALRRCP